MIKFTGGAEIISDFRHVSTLNICRTLFDIQVHVMTQKKLKSKPSEGLDYEIDSRTGSKVILIGKWLELTSNENCES